MKIKLPPHSSPCAGYTLVEVLVASGILGTLVASLLAAFTSGLAFVQFTRENMRATQILMQKMEVVRLFNWNQLTNSTLAAPTFVDWYDPLGTNQLSGRSAGVRYQGYVTVSSAPASLPPDYRDKMRLVTVKLYWTNYPNGGGTPLPHARQMQTCVARYGMQNYIY